MYATALHAQDWDRCAPVMLGVGSWSMGLGEWTQGEDSCWLSGDSLKELVWGVLWQGMLIVEVKTALELRCHSWVACKGQRGLHSLSSYTAGPTSISTCRDFQKSKYVHSGCCHLDPFMPKQAWYPSQLPPLSLPTYAKKHATVIAIFQACLHREQTLEGVPHAEVRPKSRLSPRDCH